MSVDTVHIGDQRAHVKVTGDLDLATAAALWAVLHGHLLAGRRFLRLDQSDVTFVDAATLTALQRVHDDALERRGTLVLTGVHDRIARILRIAQLDDVLFIGGSRADDDLGPATGSTFFPSRPVPWTPLAVGHRDPDPTGH
jgi:anti-anti-sigma factor